MNLIDQVASLYLCRKLKALGVKQESYFEYLFRPDFQKWEVSPIFKTQLGISAFTVAELLDIFPLEISQYLQLIKANHSELGLIYGLRTNEFFADYSPLVDVNPANAIAQVLIYLIENRDIKLNE